MPQAPGVDANTPVRKNGILIGRVKAIEDKDAGVLLKAEIYGNGRCTPTTSRTFVRPFSAMPPSTFSAGGRPPASSRLRMAPSFRGQVDPNPFDSLGQLGDLKEEFGNASRSLARAGDEVDEIGQARERRRLATKREKARAGNTLDRYHRTGDESIRRTR